MKVALVTTGLDPSRLRLQPHRTLAEMGRQLSFHGHDVVLISNGRPSLPAEDEIGGVRVRRLTSVLHPRGQRSSTLSKALETEAPDVVLLHLSVAALVHQGLSSASTRPVVGVVTSPAHSVSDLLRLGPSLVASNADLVGLHLAAALVPAGAIRHAFNGRGLRAAITLSEATRSALVSKGVPGERVRVAPPGVDQAWLDASRATGSRRSTVRQALGFHDEDFVVCYFGSPAPTRGIFTLLRAVERAAQVAPTIRVLVLSRRHEHEWRREAARLRAVAAGRRLRRIVRVVDGFLTEAELVEHVRASDLVCLPFELLPSDVPLSLLEAMALGRGVVTTSIASLPELVADGRGVVVTPRAVASLADELAAASRQPALVAQHGERARAYVSQQRTWETMGQALDQALAHAAGA